MHGRLLNKLSYVKNSPRSLVDEGRKQNGRQTNWWRVEIGQLFGVRTDYSDGFFRNSRPNKQMRTTFPLYSLGKCYSALIKLFRCIESGNRQCVEENRILWWLHSARSSVGHLRVKTHAHSYNFFFFFLNKRFLCVNFLTGQQVGWLELERPSRTILVFRYPVRSNLRIENWQFSRPHTTSSQDDTNSITCTLRPRT